jgi:hypothetical protein
MEKITNKHLNLAYEGLKLAIATAKNKDLDLKFRMQASDNIKIYRKIISTEIFKLLYA